MKTNLLSFFFIHKRAGQSVVEFSLICLLSCMLIVFGTIDLSRMVSLATRMASIAREAGRLYIAKDIDATQYTDAQLYTEVQNEVYNHIKDMIHPQGNLDDHGKLIVSILIRRDPNNNTVYTNPATFADDFIVIYRQLGYPNDAPTGWTSKIGSEGTHISQSILSLDMLRIDEQTVAIEVFHKNNMITPVGNIWNAIAPEYLYDIAYF